MDQVSRCRLKGTRVLIVDDHRDSADALAMLFSATGCEIRVAYSGESGLQLCTDFEPHIVVLDVLMPTPDGYEVARQIRKRNLDSKPILVALSGYSHHEGSLKRRLDEAGFDFYYLKPANIRELFATLSWAMAERNMAADVRVA